MTVEAVTNLNDLYPALPGAADPKSEGDDHIRNIKKALEEAFAGFTGAILITGADGGAANTYTLTPADPIEAYGLRMCVVFSPAAANTGACTLNVSGLGAKALRAVNGVDLVADDLQPGIVYPAFYNGTEFRLLSVTKQYVDQLAFSAALPQQSGNAGKALFTDGASAFWKILGTLPRSTRTANAMLVATDRGSLIDITGGTFSQTFDTPANLGSGWYCYIRNAGTGTITIPSSDGAANWPMYPGEVRVFVLDGAALSSIILQTFTLTIPASVNFVRPPGYHSFDAELWGAGGGGGGGGTGGSGGGGGAGGGYFRRLFLASDFPASPTGTPVTIGSGGNGGNAGLNGQAGGNTGLLGVIATGGAGGITSSGNSVAGTGAGIAVDPYVGATGPTTNTNQSGAPGSGKPWAGSSGGAGSGGGGAWGSIAGATGGLRTGSPGPAAVGNVNAAGANGTPFGGGAGGSSIAAGAGYNGGTGGTASGGGGGGAGTTAGGTGGKGGDGYVIIRGL